MSHFPLSSAGRILPSLVAAMVIAGAAAAEHAVAPGDDLRQALGRARAGDTVVLARGGTYRASGLVFPSGVTVTSGGAAERPAPVITTSQVVPALKPSKDDARILIARVAQRVRECYVDGRFLTLARFPNDGWLRAGAGSTPDALILADRGRLAAAAQGRWKGAQVRWRRWSWWWETRAIVGDDGAGRLDLGPDNRFQDPFTGIGSAFCVDDCLAELDAPGEWFWDAATATLHLYPPDGADAKTMTVEVATDAEPFACDGATLVGLAFARIAGTAVTIGRKSVVRDCDFRDIGENAIVTHWDCSGTVVSGCSFTDVRNVAINWNENPASGGGSLLERCRLERIGMRFGYGGSGSWHAAGVIVTNAKSLTVRLNRMVDIGYAGVITGSDGHVIDRNVFVRCMGSLNDGAAIYANSSRNVVTGNIVLDTIGNLDTSHPWYPLGHGIWMEFLSDFREQTITGNTVFGSGGHGVFLTNNYQSEVSGNTLVGNRAAGLHLSGEKGPQAHRLDGNVVAVLAPSRRLVLRENIPADWMANDYARAFEGEGPADFGRITGSTIIAAPGTVLANAGGTRWQDVAGWSQGCAWADGQARLVRATALLLINDTEREHAFDPPTGAWVDSAGKAVGKAVTVAPFRSVVLARGEAVDGLPPYILASGIDYRAPAGSAASAARTTTAKRAEKPKPAPSAQSATPSPDAWKRWLATLRDRAAIAARGRKPPRFRYSAIKAQVTVTALDGDHATLAIEGGGTLDADLFGRLAPVDAFSLAVDLLRDDLPESHALVAFFARCAGEAAVHGEHLAQAGDFAAGITAAFATP
ncbi:MAG TPA: right-handed parallel beta-helix repeat-containing protein [Planctomycetota bacterium]|nr:right-handed parallel beta-helix repeat-containing protein [Planctomycetota bacterium]